MALKLNLATINDEAGILKQISASFSETNISETSFTESVGDAQESAVSLHISFNDLMTSLETASSSISDFLGVTTTTFKNTDELLEQQIGSMNSNIVIK